MATVSINWVVSQVGGWSGTDLGCIICPLPWISETVKNTSAASHSVCVRQRLHLYKALATTPTVASSPEELCVVWVTKGSVAGCPPR